MGVLDGILGGLLSGAGQVASSWMNWQSVKDTNALNESLMREGWAREDNAVQRRTADLEAAGMNPLLAAGGAAQSSAPVRLQAPQVEGSVGLAAMQGAMSAQAISQTMAQTALTREQARKAGAEADLIEKTNPYRIDQERVSAEYAVKSLSSRLDQLGYQTDSAFYKSLIDDADAKVKMALSGMGEAWSTGVGGGSRAILPDVEGRSILARMEKARLAAVQAGASQSEAQTAALAFAVASAKLDAQALEKLGLGQRTIDLILDAAKAVSGMIGSFF